MDKKLIGWVVIVPSENGDIRTFYKVDQSTWMEDEVISRTRKGTPFKVDQNLVFLAGSCINENTN